jgi:RimJ/RimL family protein N-acetyltransferase
VATFGPIQTSLRDTPCVIRAATSDDAGSLTHLLNSFIDEGEPVLLPAPGALRLAEADIEDRIDVALRDADRLWLVAECPDDSLPGILGIRGLQHRAVEHVGRLFAGVAASARRRGIAAALLEEAIGWARGHPRIRKLTLTVVASNTPAITLYEQAGFVLEGRRVGEVRRGEKFVDDLIMARWIR